MCILLAFAGCGDRVSFGSVEESSGRGGSSATSRGSASEDDPETGSGSDAGPETDDCRLISAERVDHPAFYGHGCHDVPYDSMLLSTQRDVDAHTSAYCEACWPYPPCPKAPTLKKDTAILYASAITPSSRAHLEITSVRACSQHIVVEGVATPGCRLALDRAWDSVTVPATAKPLELHVEQMRPDCFDE